MKILSSILILISFLLVALVESLTLMPIAVKLLVGAAFLLLLGVRWKMARTQTVVTAVTVGLILLGPAAVGLSQMCAYTPAIRDEQGNRLPGSIASLERIQLGGTEQWVLIRGQNANNPVLLYLSGGPGGSELGWVRQYNPGLEDHFVVVIWEQPGAGKSYAARPYDSLTVEQILSDGLELSRILKDRFHQEKITLLGSSWGTILGVKMAQRQPDLFTAFVGMGQMVNTTENDLMSYAYALETAKQKNDTKAIAAISQYGPPPYVGENAPIKYANYLNSYVNVYDGELAGSNLPADFLLQALLTPEFGLVDQINFFRGLMDGMERIYIGQLSDMDLESQAHTLAVPVYLLEGRYDHNANAVLAERWFNQLQAPHKELIWFEQSAHAPCFTEPALFNQHLLSIVTAHSASK